eukprot:SAG25_NODE_6345_length_567_cov_1.527778_1_plen_38_part_10
MPSGLAGDDDDGDDDDDDEAPKMSVHAARSVCTGPTAC